MKLITRIVRGAALGGIGVAGLLLIAMILVIVANVVMRFLGLSFGGLYEIMAALSVMLLGLSLADSQRMKQHVAIDLLTERFNPRVQYALSVCTTLLSVIIFSTIAFALFRYASFQFTTGTTSDLLRLPTWPQLTALVVGVGLLVVVLLVDLARTTGSLASNEKKEEIW